jgi:NADH-quinone oxidoreductase subunit N
VTGAWLQALAPLLVLAAGATGIMLQIALRRDARLAQRLALGTLALAAAIPLPPLLTGLPVATVTPLLTADAPALLLSTLFCLGGAVTVAISAPYLPSHSDQQEEFYLLLVLAVLGACVLAYAVHGASLLLGLELLAVASYALIAYPQGRRPPIEAAVKYLVLSGAASATLLFGLALLYATSGSLSFGGLVAVAVDSTIASAGATLVLTGFAFKLAAAPFHLWTPDVYEGAPAPVSGFLASVAKAASLFALLRLFIDADLFAVPGVVSITALLAVLSMLAGNWLALLQANVKRLLAYSSIAHAGYLLVLFSAGAAAGQRALAMEAALFYLVAYVPTALAAFALLTQLSAARQDEELLQLDDLRGLFWRAPLLSALFFVALLSMAGIPLTAGFIAKFYIFVAAAAGGHWLLLAALVAGSAIGMFYYLRVIYVMSLQAPDDVAVAPSLPVSLQAVYWALIGAILCLGVFPGPLLGYLEGLFP